MPESSVCASALGLETCPIVAPGPSFQGGEHRLQRHDVRVLGVDVEEIGSVRLAGPVAHRRLRNDAAEAELDRVGGRRSDAAARRGAADEQGIDPVYIPGPRLRQVLDERMAGIKAVAAEVKPASN